MWVNAATRDTIIASFLELATLFDLPQQQEPDQSLVVAAVKQWFTTHSQWLLIFDNADDLALAREFLPTSETGHLLLTTGNQTIGTLGNSIDIHTLDTEQGTLLLLRRAKVLPRDRPLDQARPKDRSQAKLIVEELGSLPLALDQAAAYIEETNSDLVTYREEYHQRRDDLLRRRGETPTIPFPSPLPGHSHLRTCNRPK